MVTHKTTVVLLGLTVAISLLLCSTALPAIIPLEFPSSVETDQNPNDSTDFSYPAQGPIIRSDSSLKQIPTAVSSRSSFKSLRPRRHSAESYPFSPTLRSTRDQILHQCTTHFLELLDSKVSGALVSRLSRLLMMLPIADIEARVFMRAKLVQVMQQASDRLRDYEAIQRVIRMAVDDAGLLPVDDGYNVARVSRKGGWDGFQRIQYKDSNESSDNDSANNNSSDGINEDEENDMEENKEKATVWFRLPPALKSSRPGTRSTELDESQIPIVTEVAMEAVISYMSEVLTPVLISHQLAEAIQITLSHINKLNLLSDDWMWSSPSILDGPGVAAKDGEADSGSRGQDRELWDQEMETHNWGSTGHLFDDFENTKDKDGMEMDTGSKDEDTARDDEEEDNLNHLIVGTQEEDDFMLDEFEDDPMDSGENYERGRSTPSGSGYFNRPQERSLPEEHTVQDREAAEISAKGTSSFGNTSTAKKSCSVYLSKRRPDFTLDPRLKILLAQRIEPLLTAFIDEDFPASCKRAQGELMDAIIWSLDQSESRDIASSEQGQLALLSEFEY
ncbi:hypothetical protein BC939DRAFT_494709 [Gamsiella multidivaricata]|uniref:uncharacterized protein n=1 Tax=Gamsiella multidivaricata TaxID=101098 RepID=UPI00221F04AC|nr:uncharacterized protein BC939DRAFT_494709 [Gamsiella multidivaricata]KAG0358033.1 hypothetical protein BGZ54_000083 [Gamsiella multidivaricata]KAI7820283.1 hypothetical protein BC939DRAFT_494709 [Gamsiella multidivaricata]